MRKIDQKGKVEGQPLHPLPMPKYDFKANATATTPAGDDELVGRLGTDATYCRDRIGATIRQIGRDCAEAASRIQSLTAELAERKTVYVAVDHTGCIHSCEDMERIISIAKGSETSANAHIQSRTASNEALEREIERMTPKFVAYDYLEAPSRADAAETALTAAQAEIATLTGLVERAFKDGAHYATIVEVKNTDEARDEAWQMSSVRTALSTPQEPSEGGDKPA